MKNCAIQYSSMVYRTREKLIEVARQLFANKGVENTTMSDIATASEKGRRTIYTYFKSKREIYEATIETDSENMVKKLRAVVDEAPTSLLKLQAFLSYRLDAFELSRRQSHGVNINSILRLDFNRIEKVRRQAFRKEKEILQDILMAGSADGSFDHCQASIIMPTIVLLLQGVDYAITRNSFEVIDVQRETYKENIIQFIINLLINHNKINQNETT